MSIDTDSKSDSSPIEQASEGLLSLTVDSRGWNAVRDICRKRLEPGDFQVVSNLKSIEELMRFVDSLRIRYQDTSKAFELARLDACFYQLRTFHSSIDVFIHIKPAILAPLWGSLKLCIDLIHTTDQVLQLIVDMFDEINQTLPRIATYMEVYNEAPSLLEPAQEMYILIAEFACQVIWFFRRNPLKNLLVTTWKPFKPELDKTVSKIRQKGRQIELEAQTLSRQHDAVRYEELKHILSSLEVKNRVTLPCHYLPLARNPTLVGRNDLLDAAHNHLCSALDEQRIVSFYGLGGVGKTQISIEYVYRYLDGYSAVFWLSADSVVKMSQDVRGALEKLGAIKSNGPENDQQCQNIFSNWLKDTEEKWLIVFDNADDLKVLQGYWPTSRRGHIILTSRDPASARFPTNSKALRGLQVLPLSDAVGADMLLGVLSHKQDPSDENHQVHTMNDIEIAKDLVAQLGGLPLAIIQIANYILEAECELDEFSEIFSDFRNRSSLLDEDASNTNMSYPHSLGTVWDISMTRIEKSNKNSFHMIQIMSFFDPDGIPETLLDNSDVQRPGDALPALKYLQSKLLFLNATRPLLQQSMINKNKVQRSLVMHRLVGAITHKNITHADRQTRFDEALELLYRVYPQLTLQKASLNEQWPRCRLYVPQVLALERSYRESQEPLKPRAKFATVLSNAAWFLYENGLPGQAMQILPTAKAVAEATLKGNEFAAVTIYRTYGGIHIDANKPQISLEMWTRQMNIMKEIGSELSVAHGLSNMALAELAIGNYDDSRRELNKATEIRSKYPGQAESYKALTLDVEGMLDNAQGKYQSAINNLSAAIKLYDEELGVGNYLTAL
ncbi:hypothetical protein EJ05DRAFT_513298 [Pseudovirgaria hyperparasitica]|uniref:Uncharacterized protein n=1 Tax=Pseudovirgaria hyperparasitica TaxID=470096 RepID=A0A6A6VYQ3_9PEZI|nr:uncharacterized protein EJ05DRAFT_513298 [Pseudovirgaria hyperparasitica]KAF2754966.1 hypothetical protein EJ05DRAFT_513298 [Pseudovirgaria hyperparasitica]